MELTLAVVQSLLLVWRILLVRITFASDSYDIRTVAPIKSCIGQSSTYKCEGWYRACAI